MARHALFLKTWNEDGDEGYWYYECPTCGPGWIVMSQNVLKGKGLEMHKIFRPKKR